MSTKTSQFLIAAVSDVNDLSTLYQLQRKVRRQLKVLGVNPDKKAKVIAKKVPDALPPDKGDGVAAAADGSVTDGAATAAPTVADHKVGDTVVFGTKSGEQTKAEITKLYRKRIQVKLLEQRGTRKVLPVGTLVNVDPTEFHIQSA